MKKIYRKPVTKVIVIEDSLLNVTSPGQSEEQPSYMNDITINFDLDKIEEEGYAD